jgi:hypothetical protein
MLIAGAAGNAAWQTITKFRARRDLSNAVRKSAPDLRELNDQLAAKNLDAAAALIRGHFGELTPAERREAETALAQPSASGRASYMRGIAGFSEASAHPLPVE